MRESDVSSIEKFLELYLKEFYLLASSQCDVESNLRMKYSHSIAVHALTRKLATELNLDDQATFQVRAAALLHDIGRFPQIVECQTYDDVKSVDHAHLGARIIKEKGIISHLETQALVAIETAVRYHNKLTLPQELIGRTRTVTEVMRDADKIDIIRIAIEFYNSEIEGHRTGWFSEVSFSQTCNHIAAAALLAGKAIPVSQISTVYDEFLLYLSWVNDLHFGDSVRYLAQFNSWEYMVNTLPDHVLRNHVKDYINRRIEERCSAKM